MSLRKFCFFFPIKSLHIPFQGIIIVCFLNDLYRDLGLFNFIFEPLFSRDLKKINHDFNGYCIVRTDEGQPRPKYIFKNCGTNKHLFYLLYQGWIINNTEFKVLVSVLILKHIFFIISKGLKCNFESSIV